MKNYFVDLYYENLNLLIIRKFVLVVTRIFKVKLKNNKYFTLNKIKF